MATEPNGAPPFDPAVERDAFVAAMMARMQEDPLERDRAIAMSLYYGQEVFLQLIGAMTVMQKHGIGGMMKLLTGRG